jgi:hypothetical protein
MGGGNWLSLAGRIVLIKSILARVPIYQNSLLLSPSTIIQQMEAMQRRFLWEGGKKTGRRLHLINWDKISKPLLEGSLNFKNTKVENLALGEKLLWHIVSGDTAWSKEALWKKYFIGIRKRCIENPCRETKGSPIYNLCKKAMDLFTPHLTWVPGNRKTIKIWQDSILGDPPLELSQDLERLKGWMDGQNLNMFFEISTWGTDRQKSWQGWVVSNLPLDLEIEWCSLKLSLQGKAPIKKKEKMREDGERMLNPTPPHWYTTPSETFLMFHPTRPYGNPSETQKPSPK